MVDVKTIIKWLTFIVEIVASSVLVYFFMKSAAYLYKRYKIEKTIETVDWEKYEDGLPMPWVVFCLKIPFKDPQQIMLTSEDFENNTHDPKDYIADIFIISGPGGPIKKATPKTKTVFSVFHGRCLVLMFDIMLKGQLEGSTDYINIALKEPRKLFGYVMRPGEEIYLIHTWFPNETPKPLEFPENQGFYDVVVSYVDILDERKKNCVNTGAPKTTNTQASCVRAKAISLVNKKEQCILPWYWKLIENDPENKFIRCNESYFLEPSKDPALKYLATVPQPNDTCKKRCHRRVVNAKVVTTVSNAHECLRPSSSLLPCSTKTKEPPNGTVVVGFWFRRTDIKVISRVLKIDWTTLTANIGGAMGLYLGWGLLDIVLKMYHYIIKLIVFLSRYFLKPPIDFD